MCLYCGVSCWRVLRGGSGFRGAWASRSCTSRGGLCNLGGRSSSCRICMVFVVDIGFAADAEYAVEDWRARAPNAVPKP